MVIFKSPNKKLYRVLEEDLVHFAREKKLNLTSLRRVINKRQKSTEGWTLAEELDSILGNWGE